MLVSLLFAWKLLLYVWGWVPFLLGANAPKFPQALHNESGTVTVANTGRDGSGTVVTIFTGVAAGSIIEKVVIKALTSTVDGAVRLFHNDGSSRLLAEIKVPISTPSGRDPAWGYVWYPPVGSGGTPEWPLDGAAESLRATTETGDDFYIIACGKDYA